MQSTTDLFIGKIAADYRVILLGGLAVIAHGLSRSTMDADVWLEPMDSAGTWCHALEKMNEDFPMVTWQRLSDHSAVSGDKFVDAVENEHLIRAVGLDYPIDFFRIPNEFEAQDFTDVWMRSSKRSDGMYLPDPLDLIQSKMDTGRDKDLHDVMHLESVIRKDYSARLPTANPAEAAAMLGRCIDSTVLLAAYKNPSLEVKNLALQYLSELASDGDPFSQQALLAIRDSTAK